MQDANVVRIYGPESARMGTVVRIYSAPMGMVEIRWDVDPIDPDDGGLEDAWADELVTL